MTDLTEILKSATAEQIQKAGACKNAEELLSFAKAEGIDINAEQAEAILKTANPPLGELTDDDLDNVAGGQYGKNVIHYSIACPNCHSEAVFDTCYEYPPDLEANFQCTNCGVSSLVHGRDFVKK